MIDRGYHLFGLGSWSASLLSLFLISVLVFLRPSTYWFHGRWTSDNWLVETVVRKTSKAGGEYDDDFFLLAAVC